MIGVGAYFSAPVLAGFLFGIDPLLPVMLSVVGALALIPLLLAYHRAVPAEIWRRADTTAEADAGLEPVAVKAA